jgi:hypothetical protein
VFGPRSRTLLMGLGLLGACTRANPAYRIHAYPEDAADSPPETAEPDAATPDRSSPDVETREDLGAPADLVELTPDLGGPDLAADLGPDLGPDSGVSSTGLVAHWRFDEGTGTSVADATGNGNTGATRGGPVWTTGFPAAKFSNPGALVLDGEDDYVEITIKSVPANAAAKTLALWFKASNPTAIPIRNLVALINDTTDVGIQLGLDQGRVAAWFYGAAMPLVNAPSPVDGNWHHAAYVFDGNVHRIYLDGARMASTPAIPKTGTMNRARLGTYQVPDEMFAGTIDDVRIYARALGDAEVAALWNGQ